MGEIEFLVAVLMDGGDMWVMVEIEFVVVGGAIVAVEVAVEM